MPEESPHRGPVIRKAMLRLAALISRLDESQHRNPFEVLGPPADGVVLDLVNDMIHLIPEGDSISRSLRRYIDNPRNNSGEMKIVDVLPMLEMLSIALSDALATEEAPKGTGQAGANMDSPKGDFELHHSHKARLPSVSTYRPEVRTSDPGELAYSWPYRRLR
jgi:hypothetical protein